MWLFAAVSLAICTPCVRSALEALFAELSVVFFNHLALVALATALAFVAALALHYTLVSKQYQAQQQESAAHDEKPETENKRSASTSSLQKASMISAETLRAWCGHQLDSRSSANCFRVGASKRAKKAAAAGNSVRVRSDSCIVV